MCIHTSYSIAGTVDRTAGQSVHKVRSLQQRERAALARLLGEDGPGERLELPHLAAQRGCQVFARQTPRCTVAYFSLS